jgi:hypothetical protein
MTHEEAGRSPQQARSLPPARVACPGHAAMAPRGWTPSKTPSRYSGGQHMHGSSRPCHVQMVRPAWSTTCACGRLMGGGQVPHQPEPELDGRPHAHRPEAMSVVFMPPTVTREQEPIKANMRATREARASDTRRTRHRPRRDPRGGVERARRKRRAPLRFRRTGPGRDRRDPDMPNVPDRGRLVVPLLTEEPAPLLSEEERERERAWRQRVWRLDRRTDDEEEPTGRPLPPAQPGGSARRCSAPSARRRAGRRS